MTFTSHQVALLMPPVNPSLKCFTLHTTVTWTRGRIHCQFNDDVTYYSILHRPIIRPAQRAGSHVHEAFCQTLKAWNGSTPTNEQTPGSKSGGHSEVLDLQHIDVKNALLNALLHAQELSDINPCYWEPFVQNHGQLLVEQLPSICGVGGR
jgi:hypothetical protein